MTSMFYEASAQIFKNAKQLRSTMTGAEKLLWERLSNNQLLNYRFRRQHPIEVFIADFYCHKAKLVIEIDGGYHSNQDQVIYDSNRTHQLNSLGINVLRFSNDQVQNHIEEVINEIKKTLPLNPLRRA